MSALVRTADGREYAVDLSYEDARDRHGELARGGYASWEVSLTTGDPVTLHVPNITAVLPAPTP